MLPRRPVTRQPFPPGSQLRHALTTLLYRTLGVVLAPRFRRTVRLDDLAAARILILKPCCLGDIIFATPLLRELRRSLPDAYLAVAVGAHARPGLAGHPAVDELIDTGPIGSGRLRPRAFLALARYLQARQFDACFVLERSALLIMLPWLAGIPIRVGIDSGGRGFSLTVAVSARPARPESELYLDLLRVLGGRPQSGTLEYHPSPAANQQIERLVNEQIGSRPFVILHCAGGVNPGMALVRKRWPAENFARLASRVLAAGAAIVLVGAREDRPTAERVRADLAALGNGTTADGVIDLVGALNLDELAALARRAVVYVGNDSGPSHLVEAAGARVVMLFGPSDPIVYGPRGRNAIAITAGLWCSPCFIDGRVAPCANVLCMPAITVERVWQEIAPLLRAAGVPT
jgi:lipopolysaccharide heptosyltransferase II